MSSGNSAARASAWAILGGAGTRGISFLVFLLIARELSPSDMGVMAIALSFGMLIDTVSELGLGDQVVRSQGKDDSEFVSSVFWAQLGVAACGAVMMILVSPWLAAWYKEPDLLWACLGVALACVANGASLVPVSLLNKKLEFKAIAIRNALATVVGGGVGLALAHWGWGVKALVIMHLVNALTGCAAALWSCAWRPQLRCQWQSLRSARRLALHSMGTRVVETVISRLDQLLIGSIFGTGVLGLYALAVRFFDVIFQTLCGPVAVVLFSHLAQVHQDKDELRRRYLRALRNLVLLAPPVFVLAAIVLPDVLVLIFGQKWAGVTTYLWLILGAGAVLSFTFSHTPVFSAVGQPRINLVVSSASSVLWLLSLLLLPQLGAVYAAVLWVIRATLGVPIQLYFLHSVVGLKLRDYGRAIAPGLVMSAVLVLFLNWMTPVERGGAVWQLAQWGGVSLAAALWVVVGAYRYSPDVRVRLRGLLMGWNKR